MSFKSILATAVALTLSAGAASAAVLDFYQEASGNERGILNGNSVMMSGVNVTFNATSTNSQPGDTVAAYFDNGAGLGVCSDLVPDIGPGDNDCDPGSDDNLRGGEELFLSFDSAFNLSGLKLRAEGHGWLSGAVTVLFAVNGGTLMDYTYAELTAKTFSNVTSMRFAYGGNAPDQYYLSAATVVPVPLPAAGLMLLAGLGALGAARRRRG